MHTHKERKLAILNSVEIVMDISRIHGWLPLGGSAQADQYLASFPIVALPLILDLRSRVIGAKLYSNGLKSGVRRPQRLYHLISRLLSDCHRGFSSVKLQAKEPIRVSTLGHRFAEARNKGMDSLGGKAFASKTEIECICRYVERDVRLLHFLHRGIEMRVVLYLALSFEP